MRIYLEVTQSGKSLGRFPTENLSRAEAIDQQGGTTATIGVRQHVESLQAGGVGEVGVVGMGGEREAGICCVLEGEIRGKLPEGSCERYGLRGRYRIGAD